MNRTPLHHRRRSGSVVDAVVVTALLGVASLVVLSRLAVPVPSDQLNYMHAAADLPGRPSNPVLDHQYLRLGLIGPMRAVQEVFGFSQVSYHLVPVLASLLLAVATYAVGRLLLGRAVGAAAGLAVVGNSILIRETSMPLPDVLAAALLTAAIAVALALHQGRPFVAATARRRAAALLAIGGFLGWGYLTREFTVFVWPVVPLLLWRRIAVRELLWAVTPVIVAVGVELVYGALVFDDPLARAKAVSEHGSGPVREDLAATYKDKPRSEYLARLPDTLSSEAPADPWLRTAVWVALISGLVFVRRLWPLLLWGLLLWVPLTLFGGVLDPSEPKLRLQLIRYWYPIFPAIAVASLGGIWLLVRLPMVWMADLATSGRRMALRGLATAVAGSLVLSLAWVVVDRGYDSRPPDAVSQGRHDLEALRDWLSTEGQDIDAVWADRRTARILPLFQVDPVGRQRWDGDVKIWRSGQPAPAAGEVVVLVGPTSDICGWCRRYTAELLGWPVRVPPDWELLFATTDREVQVWRVA